MTEKSNEDQLNNVIRIFFIIIGICLFFFFLILIPYFSLRFDSKSIEEINSEFKTKNMTSSLDKFINESKELTSTYDSIPAEYNDSKTRLLMYESQLDKNKIPA
jgi:uncharacterized membrane protein SpoIIM required for sporulation